MSDNPKILPKPLNAPNTGASAKSLFSNPKSKSSLRVGVACFPCKSKRSKCDGTRPTCNTCIEKNSECVYPTKAGQSHSQAKKELIQRLLHKNGSMFDVLWYLQTTSLEKASKFLHQIRSFKHGDIGAMSEYLAKDDMFQRSDRHASFSSETDIGESSWGGASVDTEDESQPTVISNERSSVFRAPHGQDTTIEGTRAPLEMFFRCIGGLFYICDKSEVDATFGSIASMDLSLATLVSSSESMAIRTYSAELAVMAALGMIHLRIQMPKTVPSIELADFYFNVGKHGLDDAIVYNPLRAMKLCALIALYHISVHANVALAYIGQSLSQYYSSNVDLDAELGLSLARNHADQLEQVTSDMTSETMSHRRTHQTLVHLHCWLSASFGLRSNSLKLSMQMTVDERDKLRASVVQQQAVKITILKATFIQITAESFNQEADIANFRAKLSSFHSDMPKWMSITQLQADSSNDTGLASGFYVHLFYMSAMMVLSRRLIIAHVPLDSIGKVALSKESSLAMEEGFVAARMSAKIMGHMLSDGNTVPMCWLCIFTAYAASLMIIYSGIQKRLLGIYYGLSEDIDLISKCQTILGHCTKRDKLAQTFQTTVSKSLEILQSDQIYDESCIKPRDDDVPTLLIDILFTIHTGATPLHGAARELLALLHASFGGLPKQQLGSVPNNPMEDVLDMNGDWKWELDRETSDMEAGDEWNFGGGGEDDQATNSFSMVNEGDSTGWTSWTSPSHF